MIEEKMNSGRDEHTAYGRYDGKKGFLKIGQFPDVELTLNLQSYEEEENGHEAVVDAMFYRMPEMKPGTACAGIGNEYGHDGTAHEQEAPCLLAVEKFPE